MNYSELKKLDENTSKNLKEGSGPVDECLCTLLAPPDDEKPRGIRTSIKKIFQSIGGKNEKNKTSNNMMKGSGKSRGPGGLRGSRVLEGSGGMRGVNLPGASGRKTVEIPLTFTKGKNGIYTTKETLKGNTSCGKCGCSKEKVVLKHSYATIRISSPDVSSLCPCPSDCLPAEKYNKIKMSVD